VVDDEIDAAGASVPRPDADTVTVARKRVAVQVASVL
jgi:hypothetical protein